MSKDIFKRINQQKVLLREISLNENIYLYLSWNWRRDLNKNHVYWAISRNTLSVLLLDINKLLDSRESFSFQKLTNVMNQKMNFKNSAELTKIQDELKILECDCANHIKLVKDKYLSHLDYNAPQISTDLKKIRSLIHDLKKNFNKILKLLNQKKQIYRKQDNALKAIFIEN